MEPPLLHQHPHAHRPGSDDRRRRKALAWAIAITSAMLVAEVIAGVLTNSLALLADAVHMGTDVGALSLALFAVWLASKAHSPQRSYGYHRVEILAALANGVALWAASGYIIYEAVGRLGDPPDVESGLLLIVATIGLVANLVTARILMSTATGNLNIRAAMFHVTGDALGSVGVILAGLLILGFSWTIADPIIGLVIGLLILVSSARLIWPAIHILLEGTPPEVNLETLHDAILGTTGVQAVHDIHAWALTSGNNAMTAHVVLDPDVPFSEREQVLDRLRHMIPDRFHIGHTTIQLEESSACCDVQHLLNPSSESKGAPETSVPSAHSHS